MKTAGARQQQRDRSQRRGFTLVELLVVIGIIGVLSSMILFALYGVQEDARERRTRVIVGKIDELLRDQWDSYRHRTLPMNFAPNTDPRTAAGQRVNAIREMMRMELPDRKNDLYDPRFPPSDPRRYNPPLIALQSYPSFFRTYQRKASAQLTAYWSQLPAPFTDPNPDWTDDARWTPEHQSSECLYLIITTIQAIDGRDNILALREVGDTDEVDVNGDGITDFIGDGMPEILDAWSIPIRFLRWPAGFARDISEPLQTAYSDIIERGQPDPFDPLKQASQWSDPNPNERPFALYPLLYSAGKDKRYGLTNTIIDPNTGQPLWYPATAPQPNDPYVEDSNGRHVGFQDLSDPNAAGDNITNHYIQVDSP